MLGFKAAFWLLAAAMVQLSLCAEDYYNILGVGKSASEKEIKNAYRSLSKKYHPDKNPGDDTAHDKFVEVSEAYEVLSNSEARQIYDRYGVDGLQNFRNRRQNGHDAYPRGNNVEVKLEIALRDFYNGATTEFAWNKQHLCDQCDGTGSADKEVDTCRQCDGHGHITKKMMIMPGVYQQIRSPCNACGGRGKTIRNVCPACQGSRVMNKLTTVTLNIERGKPVDSQVVYENEAHQSPDWIAGDLLVTLAEKHPSLDDNNPDRVDGTFFHRNGDDLFWTEVLSLREAWMGDWTRNITHLDAHTVRLGRRRGEVVQPGHIETIVGQGMPKWHEDGESVYHKHEFGNLYVEYVVVLPDRMDGGMLDEFWSLWQKWRGKHGVDLQKDSGRPEPNDGHVRDEL